MQQADPLILTAAFDPRSAEALQRLRDRHFPPERNIVPAHLTLFHHLPGVEQAAILGDIAAIAAPLRPLSFTTAEPRFLGRGCALGISAMGLGDLHAALARRWTAWLTPQDRQPFRPHVTVQNKVPPEVARALWTALSGLPPLGGTIDGLDLWFYRGGPWQRASHIAFAAPRGSTG